MTKMLDEIFQQPAVLGGIESENKAVLTALVEDLNARKISHALLAARGSSDHAAIYGKYLLGVYKGIVSGLAMPSVITSYNSKPDMSQDLVIGISQSGEAADAIAVLEAANAQGGITVAITNNTESPLAKIAKYHLYCNAGLEESVAATKTFTAQLYLLALLTAYWSADEQLLKDLRKLPASLDNSIKSINALAAASVARYRYITEGFILARGFCYPIAMEMALKTQETCYIKMQGHAISDFYHGPMAQVTPDVPVIVLAPQGKSFKDAEEVIKKITDIGAQILVITDDKALAEKHDHSILLSAIDSEATSVFLYTVFAQCFAQSLSISKGLNPDCPRLLKKVTITK